MINPILSMPISFIKPKHPSIFTYIIFRKNDPNHTCNKSSKQPRKHSTHSQTRSGETLASRTQRILAQARWATWDFHEFSLRRDLLAWARHGVAQNVDWSPRRVLVAVSTLLLSPRRDELAWARITDLTTVLRMQGRKTTLPTSKSTCNSVSFDKTHYSSL